MTHPNATVAGGGATAGILLVWILSLVGVELPPAVAAVTAGLIPVALLFIGRNGLRGVLRLVWRGR